MKGTCAFWGSRLAGARVGSGVGGQEHHLLTRLHHTLLHTASGGFSPQKETRATKSLEKGHVEQLLGCHPGFFRKRGPSRGCPLNPAVGKGPSACKHITHALDLVDAGDGHAHGCAHGTLRHSAHLVEHVVHLVWLFIEDRPPSEKATDHGPTMAAPKSRT